MYGVKRLFYQGQRLLGILETVGKSMVLSLESPWFSRRKGTRGLLVSSHSRGVRRKGCDQDCGQEKGKQFR